MEKRDARAAKILCGCIIRHGHVLAVVNEVPSISEILEIFSQPSNNEETFICNVKRFDISAENDNSSSGFAEDDQDYNNSI